MKKEENNWRKREEMKKRERNGI